MPPKFQSSFIPKGPLTSSQPSAAYSMHHRTGERSFFSSVALFIFSASILLALGVFGYRFFLQYRIDQMSGALTDARAALDPEAIAELTRLTNRIISTKNLVSEHQVITSLLAFLESSTLRSVRFLNFDYSQTERGLELSLNGEARGYPALALPADTFSQSRYFIDTSFSGLTLNDKGDVTFNFTGVIHSDLVSYSVTPTVSTSTESNLPII